MDDFVLCILNTSLIVGAGIVVFSLLLFFGGKRYSAKCRKTIWILMAFCLLIPFRLMPVPKAYTAEIPNVVLREADIPETGYAGGSTVQDDMGQSTSGEVMQAQSLSSVSGKEVTVADVLFVIWACVGAAMAAYHLAGYRRMRRKIRQWGHDCEDAGIQKILAEICARYQMKRLPELRILKDPATGPFTTGVLRNIIVLPDEIQDEKDMWFILKHEVLHCRNKDILWKLLFLAVGIVHWFNPLVWVLRRAAEQDMEIACDEEVVSCATREDRREYSNVIMSWVERSRYKGSTVSTGYVQGVRFLKRRFDCIINGGRKKKGILLIGTACVFVLLTGSMIRITMRKDFVGIPNLALEGKTYYGEGYAITVPENDWIEYVYNSWCAVGNEQVRFWISNYAGLDTGQVERILMNQGYQTDESGVWKQEGDTLYYVQCVETEQDVWALNSVISPTEQHEYWRKELQAIFDTFVVEDGYDVRAAAPKVVMPAGENLQLSEGIYADDTSRQWVLQDPDYTGSYIYNELIISNVTDRTFDFEVVCRNYETNESEMIIPWGTAYINEDGISAVYEGEDYTLTFDFTNRGNPLPVVVLIEIWGVAELEGISFSNYDVPGYDAG